MMTTMALQSPIFPIDQPIMPEERQIGRLSSIEGLQKRLWGVAHQWLIGERRIGKTSVAKAVLARLRKLGAVALDVDLSKLSFSTPQALADEIIRQVEAIVEKIPAGADGGQPGLENVFEALAMHARATERRTYLLLDEVHLLPNLGRAEALIGQWCREPGSPIVCVFAGSEESAALALRETGRPLAAVGEEFRLPPIAYEDWVPGLRGRFAEAAVEISDPELDAILQASGCHPRRTMLVASRVRASVELQGDRVATPILVELAIRAAEGDRSWR